MKQVQGEHLIEYAPFSDDHSDVPVTTLAPNRRSGAGSMTTTTAPSPNNNGLLETSVLGLRWSLGLDPGSSSGGAGSSKTPAKIVLNCTAAIGSVYWSWASLTLFPDTATRHQQEPWQHQQQQQQGRPKPMLMYHESHLAASASAAASSASSVLPPHTLLVSVFVIALSFHWNENGACPMLKR